MPPITSMTLVAGPMVNGVRSLILRDFPGFCYVFKSCQIPLVADIVCAMQEDNQPHNMLFTPRQIFVFPKPQVRPARSFELYPETVGGPELIGSFTVYRTEDYELLNYAAAEELIRLNTAPLPSRLLQRGGGCGVDDAALQQAVTRHVAPVPSSRSVDHVLLTCH